MHYYGKVSSVRKFSAQKILCAQIFVNYGMYIRGKALAENMSPTLANENIRSEGREREGEDCSLLL